MSGYLTISDTNQVVASVTSQDTYTDVVDLSEQRRADIAVDVSGTATLTLELSSTGDFGGEEYTRTIEYDSATEIIEQFDPAHQYIRALVNQNLNRLEVVGRGV